MGVGRACEASSRSRNNLKFWLPDIGFIMLHTIHRTLEERLSNCQHDISAMQQWVLIVGVGRAYIASVSIA